MKITIFGSSGNTGKPLLRQALTEGHEVTAFVRDPAKLGNLASHVKIVPGDVREYDDVEPAIIGADAIISTLSKWGQKPDILSLGAANMINAMERHRVSRIVTLTGAAMLVPKDYRSFGNRLAELGIRALASGIYRDAYQHYEMLAASKLDWTIVRSPPMIDRPARGIYQTGYLKLHPFSWVAYEDTADFLLHAATARSFVRELPMISY